MESQSSADESRVSQLETLIRELSEAAREADRRCEESVRRLRVAEQQMEESEKRASKAERRVLEVEGEMRAVQTALRSRELTEEKLNERELQYANQLRVVGDRFRDVRNFTKSQLLKSSSRHSASFLCFSQAQRRAEAAERDALKRQQEIENLEQRLEQERQRYRALREEMDRYVNELQNI